MEKNLSFREQMEQYEAELRRLQQRAVTQPSAVSETAGEATFTAPLQVRVTAADEAIPIEGALVVVTRMQNGEPVVEAVRLTNESGLTEPILLSAADPSATLQPNTVVRAIVHNVTVSAPDYRRVTLSNVPLYGGIPTELPVSMVPLPEFVESSDVEYDTPSPNL